MDAPTPRRTPEWGAIHRLCLNETRRILGPGARADDAAQEAIIRAWRHWDRRSHSDAVPAWVRTIARREAYRIAGRAPRETPTGELEASSCDDPQSRRIDAVDLSGLGSEHALAEGLASVSSWTSGRSGCYDFFPQRSVSHS